MEVKCGQVNHFVCFFNKLSCPVD